MWQREGRYKSGARHRQSEQIFNCPGDSANQPFRSHASGTTGFANYGSYAVNAIGLLGAAPNSGNPDYFPPVSYLPSNNTARLTKLSSFTSPAETVWVGDNGGGNFRWLFTTDYSTDLPALIPGNPTQIQGNALTALSERHLETVRTQSPDM